MSAGGEGGGGGGGGSKQLTLASLAEYARGLHCLCVAHVMKYMYVCMYAHMPALRQTGYVT